MGGTAMVCAEGRRNAGPRIRNGGGQAFSGRLLMSASGFSPRNTREIQRTMRLMGNSPLVSAKNSSPVRLPL
jgi:hypothetical protein